MTIAYLKKDSSVVKSVAWDKEDISMNSVIIAGTRYNIVHDSSIQPCQNCDLYHTCDISQYLECLQFSSQPHHLEEVSFKRTVARFFDTLK